MSYRRVASNDKEVKLDVARNALVQLNVMVDQGIEPDVFMYNNLISVMADAGLEWQAYKLFSRLLERGIQPIPETYVALKLATDPSRKTTIADLDRRIKECAAELPGRVARREVERRGVEARDAERVFNTLLSDDALTSLRAGLSRRPNAFDVSPSSAAPTSDTRAASANVWPDEGSIPTMTPVTPRTALRADDVIAQTRDEAKARFENKEREPELREMLATLHDEELRMLLAVHRLHRPDKETTREQITTWILNGIPYQAIYAVIARRKRYFAAVASALELQMRELSESGAVDWNALRREVYDENGNIVDGAGSTNPDASPTASNAATPQRASEALESVENRDTALGAPSSNPDELLDLQLSGGLSIDRATTGNITERDAFVAQPSSLTTPWGGIIRKPPAKLAQSLNYMNVTPPTQPRNALRDASAALTDDELLEIFVAANTNEMERIPTRLLRNYSRVNRIGWRRTSGIVSLQRNVAWHVLTYPPAVAAQVGGVRQRGEDVEKRLQQQTMDSERRGLNKSVEAFDALRIIAQRCGNAQIVDAASVSNAIRRLQKKARILAKAESETRVRIHAMRESKVAEESLQHFPTSKLQELNSKFASGKDSSISALPRSRVIGLVSGSQKEGEDPQPESNPESEIAERGDSSDDPKIRELPPWAVRTGSLPFDLRNGRFGDATRAQLKERADGKIGVSFEAQRGQRFSIDVDSLPQSDREVARSQLLESELQATAPSAQQWRNRKEEREKSPDYRKFAAFLSRAQAKEAERAELRRSQQPAPLKMRRMSSVLQKGRDFVKPVRRRASPTSREAAEDPKSAD